MKIEIETQKHIGSDGKVFWTALARTGADVKPYAAECLSGDTAELASARAVEKLREHLASEKTKTLTHYELDLETGKLS